MFDKFLVVKWKWLEEALSNEELETLFELLNKATEDKPEYKYYVVNTDETYAEKVRMIIEGRKEQISRDKVLAGLQELAQLKDIELAHLEADDLLIKYLNDVDIEKIYEEVPKWYA